MTAACTPTFCNLYITSVMTAACTPTFCNLCVVKYNYRFTLTTSTSVTAYIIKTPRRNKYINHVVYYIVNLNVINVPEGMHVFSQD